MRGGRPGPVEAPRTMERMGEDRRPGDDVDLPQQSQIRDVGDVEVTLLSTGEGRWEVATGSTPIGRLMELPGSLDEPWRHFTVRTPAGDGEGVTDDWRAAVGYLLRVANEAA